MSLGERAAPHSRANALVFGQLAGVLDDGQVAVVPPWRTGPILPLAPLARRGGVPIITLAFEVIRAILGRRFFALSTEELILELSVLTAKIVRPRLQGARPDARPERAEPSNTRPVAAVRSSHAAVRRLPGAARATSRRSCRTSSDKSAGSVAGSGSTSVSSMTGTLVTQIYRR